jgi:hypothetical protein
VDNEIRFFDVNSSVVEGEYNRGSRAEVNRLVSDLDHVLDIKTPFGGLDGKDSDGKSVVWGSRRHHGSYRRVVVAPCTMPNGLRTVRESTHVPVCQSRCATVRQPASTVTTQTQTTIAARITRIVTPIALRQGSLLVPIGLARTGEWGSQRALPSRPRSKAQRHKIIPLVFNLPSRYTS